MSHGIKLLDMYNRYGMVAFAVHCSLTAVGVSGFYFAINNNVDVQTIFKKMGLPTVAEKEVPQQASQPPSPPPPPPPPSELLDDSIFMRETTYGFGPRVDVEPEQKNRTLELVASSGGAFALACMYNRALLPLRIPLTIALTPAAARFWAMRKIYFGNLF